MSPDPSTTQGTERPERIEPYDSDHTALVHVLWDARRLGLTLDDADDLAAMIRNSKWMRAVRAHARSEEAPDAD